MTDSLHDRVHAAIGEQYRIEHEIGRGGMSVVYRARDLRLNRSVAIKVLPPELAYDPTVGSRFTREAQTSAQLAHPNIVPIYDVGERDGIAYFVMGLITGGNLAALLEHQPRRPIDEVRRLLPEIADALSYAHLRGVIHRDIKADNILLDAESGRAMVTDFGIARAVESGTRLTVTGIAVGTPTYMSPEQALGEREIDGRSDIYSLGVLGYQMLTGRVPFTATNQMALLLKHVSERPRPITDLRPEAPKALADAIERALLKAPEDRWPTAAAFRDAVASGDIGHGSWRAESREPVRYTSPVPRGRRDPRAGEPRESRNPVARRDDHAATSELRDNAATNAHGLVMIPGHLAALTPAQRDDLRLWGGRIELFDRIKAMRSYALLTGVMAVASLIGVGVGLSGDAPPFVLAPIVPFFMFRKLQRRGRSLRESGLKLRRVFNAGSARNVLPAPPPAPTDKQLQKIAPREILESPRGALIRAAAEERAAILDIVAHLSKADRALLPDVEPTVNALVDRVAHLAKTLHRMDGDIDPTLVAELDARIARMAAAPSTVEDQRRSALIMRQRATMEELMQRRASLAQQMDNAALALGNLKLDLIKLRSSGLESAVRDVSTATQEARALSRDISLALDAAAEVKNL
jgi:serine/threonine-protein kinase